MANPSTPAYHEAGHAVMAMLCGIRVLRMTLSREDGSTETDDEPPCAVRSQAERELLEKFVLFALAGWAAQAIVRPLSLNMCMHSSDRDKARVLLRGLVSGGATEERITELMELWLERAVGRITDKTAWRTVEAIATELEKKRFLSEAEVQRLFDRSMGDT